MFETPDFIITYNTLHHEHMSVGSYGRLAKRINALCTKKDYIHIVRYSCVYIEDEKKAYMNCMFIKVMINLLWYRSSKISTSEHNKCVKRILKECSEWTSAHVLKSILCEILRETVQNEVFFLLHCVEKVHKYIKKTSYSLRSQTMFVFLMCAFSCVFEGNYEDKMYRCLEDMCLLFRTNINSKIIQQSAVLYIHLISRNVQYVHLWGHFDLLDIINVSMCKMQDTIEVQWYSCGSIIRILRAMDFQHISSGTINIVIRNTMQVMQRYIFDAPLQTLCIDILQYIATDLSHLRILLQIGVIPVALSSLRKSRLNNTLQTQGSLLLVEITNNRKSPSNILGIISCAVECMSTHHTDVELQDINCNILLNICKQLKKRMLFFFREQTIKTLLETMQNHVACVELQEKCLFILCELCIAKSCRFNVITLLLQYGIMRHITILLKQHPTLLSIVTKGLTLISRILLSDGIQSGVYPILKGKIVTLLHASHQTSSNATSITRIPTIILKDIALSVEKYEMPSLLSFILADGAHQILLFKGFYLSATGRDAMEDTEISEHIRVICKASLHARDNHADTWKKTCIGLSCWCRTVNKDSKSEFFMDIQRLADTAT